MSEPRFLARERTGGTCKVCDTKSHVHSFQIYKGLECVHNYISLCRKCRHIPLSGILTQDELSNLQLLRDVLGEMR